MTTISPVLQLPPIEEILFFYGFLSSTLLLSVENLFTMMIKNVCVKTCSHDSAERFETQLSALPIIAEASRNVLTSQTYHVALKDMLLRVFIILVNLVTSHQSIFTSRKSAILFRENIPRLPC